MKLPVFSLLCALSLSACAQSTPPASTDAKPDADKPKPAAASVGATSADPKEAKIRAALKNLNADLEPTHIGPSTLPGFQEVIVKGMAVYVSDDGRYLIQGVLDLNTKEDLSQLGALPKIRRDVLAKIPVNDRIVFAPLGPAKHTVSVFTDIECGFCRKLHEDIAEYNKLGISIQYLAFPRAGLESPDAKAMESVWCSADRRKALTDAKAGRAVPPKSCPNPVAVQYQAGQSIGLQGTPMVVNTDGIALAGYMPPDKMLEALDKLAAQAKDRKTAQAGSAGSP